MPWIDPEQRITTDWVRAWFPGLDALCEVTLTDEDGISAWRCRVLPAERDGVAWRLAVGIAARKLATRPDLFADWFGAATGTVDLPVSAAHLDLMQVHGLLVDVGTPTEPANEFHFFGLLAESVLHELLWDVDHGLGTPAIIEGHDWSATDKGGDKLAIYVPDTGPAFRLWESKGLSSLTKTTTAVVAEAADQLEVRAASYLARYTNTVSRSVDDEDLATFVASMPELWVNNNPRAGVGVAVTTHDAPAAQTCFAQLAARFDLPNANKAGHLTLLGPLVDFRQIVCRLLWKGAGLWTGP